MTRLPVSATVRVAWAAAGDNRALLLRLAILPFVATLAIDLLPELATTILRDAPSEAGVYRRGPLDHPIVKHLLTLLKLALQSAFIAQAYRLFLLGPAAVVGDGWFRFGPEGRRLFLVVLIIAVLTDLPFRTEGALFFLPFYSLYSLLVRLPTGISDFLTGQSPDLHFALAVGLFVLVYLTYLFTSWALAMRLAFVLPTACLGRPWDFTSRWRETRGNGWRLFAGLLRVGFLVLLIGVLVEAWARDYPGVVEWFESLGRGEEVHFALKMLKRAASWVCTFAIHTLWAAVTTAAFAQLTGYAAKGVRLPVPHGHAAVST